MNLPAKRYTEEQLDRAKSTQRVIGWLQGAGVAVGGAVLLKLLGWIPVLLVLVAVGWVVFKVLGGSRGKGQGDDGPAPPRPDQPR